MALHFGSRDDDPVSMAWRSRGRCRGVDPSVFYPESEEDPGLEAKAICAECTVREACLEHAIAKREKAGVWGGMTFRERRSLIRRRRRRQRAS